MPRFSNVHLIVNPGSGSADGLAPRLTSCFEEGGLPYSVHEISDDAGPDVLARRAVEQGADLVAACGGDGTIGAAAGALADTKVPLLVIPGGTANIFASELGIPGKPEVAASLATGELTGTIVDVDLVEVKVNGTVHPLILRMGLGIEATMVTQTTPEVKRRFGKLAYGAKFLAERRRQKKRRYRITIDEKVKYVAGTAVLICNSANPGVQGVSMLAGVSARDGLIHVVLIKRLTYRALGSVFWHAIANGVRGRGFDVTPSPTIRVWCGKSVTVEVSHHQDAAVDGEGLGTARRASARIRPGAVRMLVPEASPFAN